MTARAGRTYTLLLGIGVAGALIWIATRVGATPTWRYWAALGLLAGAGLAFALTQRTAYGAWSEVTPLGFLLALAAALICVGWIAAFGQPNGNWFRSHASSWSHDIGIRGFVDHMKTYVSVMAFGLGALLASAPGAVGRQPSAPPEPASVERPAPAPEPTVTTNGDGEGAGTTARDRARGFSPIRAGVGTATTHEPRLRVAGGAATLFGEQTCPPCRRSRPSVFSARGR